MSGAGTQALRLAELAPRLVAEADADALLGAARETLAREGDADVFARAVGFALDADRAPLELSFIGLYTALESALTFFRRQGDYHVIPREEFARFEADLRGWLRRHPALEGEPARRALLYEKVPELNRFPFSHVFKQFCARYGLDLSDLWPLVGPAGEWPLVEIRHRLVHGDPFRSRPASAVECAREHLRWTAARMILSLLGWPVGRSLVSPEALSRRAAAHHAGWREERARLA
ncbi:MAG TPA: hypothetical protein VF586_18180 [Pyrinomonadaceae bacterium]